MIAILKTMVYSCNIEINLEDMEMTDCIKAARAIKQELKILFKNIKFSVTSQSTLQYDCVSVRWVGGPSYCEIQTLTNKYQSNFDLVPGLPQTYVVSLGRQEAIA